MLHLRSFLIPFLEEQGACPDGPRFGKPPTRLALYVLVELLVINFSLFMAYATMPSAHSVPQQEPDGSILQALFQCAVTRAGLPVLGGPSPSLPSTALPPSVPRAIPPLPSCVDSFIHYFHFDTLTCMHTHARPVDAAHDTTRGIRSATPDELPGGLRVLSGICLWGHHRDRQSSLHIRSRTHTRHTTLSS